MLLPDNRMLFSTKKKLAIKPMRSRRKLNCILVRKQPFKRLHIYDSNCIMFCKRQNYETVKRSVIARGWEKGVMGRCGAWRIYGAGNRFVRRHNGGYAPLYICANPRNVQQE